MPIYSDTESGLKAREQSGSFSRRQRGKSKGRNRTDARDVFKKKRTRITPRGKLAMLGAGILFIAVVLALLISSTPLVEKINPENGAVLTENPFDFKILFGKEVNASSIDLIINGEARTSDFPLSGNEISGKLDLEDGEHNLEVFHDGKLAGRSSFYVDATPPVITINETHAGEDGISVIHGTAHGAIALTADENKIPIDENGSFSVEVNRFEKSDILLVAVDRVGNRTEFLAGTSPPPSIKGIHVSFSIAADRKLFNNMVDLVNRTELNGMQIDVKDESGMIGYDSSVELANEIGSDMPSTGMNLGAVMDKCWYNDIFTIGRVVCFKDPVLARKRPDLAVKDASGGAWGDGTWVDPYSKEVWDYLLEVSLEAVSHGFEEIQFDYMRFPSDGGDITKCVYPFEDDRTKDDVITEFMDFMRTNLKQHNVVLSGDLFGLTASGQGSMGIGQDVAIIGQYLDYICPMVYPSHYNRGEYGIPDPEADPYQTVYKSLEDFLLKLEGTDCKLRPWLQDFSMRIPYGANEVRAQIQACYDLGIYEWLLWDPHCRFTEGALEPASAND